MCDYETIESVNDDLFSNLSELVNKPFFRYFQVRLDNPVGMLLESKFLPGGPIPRVSVLARRWFL